MAIETAARLDFVIRPTQISVPEIVNDPLMEDNPINDINRWYWIINWMAQEGLPLTIAETYVNRDHVLPPDRGHLVSMIDLSSWGSFCQSSSVMKGIKGCSSSKEVLKTYSKVG